MSTSVHAAAPRFDHHQHLLSPAGALLLNAALPAIELPPEVARLVAQRQAAWNDQNALAELYAEDAMALSTNAPGWIRGRARVASYLGSRFARPFRITPVTWKQDGARAELSGYFTRGEGADTWHFGYVYLGLTKDPAGGWRIAIDATDPNIFYFSSQNGLPGGLRRSIDGGMSHQPLGGAGLSGGSPWVTIIKLDPTHPIVAPAANRIVFVCGYNQLFRSTNGGTSW